MMCRRTAEMMAPATLALALIGGSVAVASSLKSNSPADPGAAPAGTSPWLLLDPEQPSSPFDAPAPDLAAVLAAAEPATPTPIVLPTLDSAQLGRVEPILVRPTDGRQRLAGSGPRTDETRIPEPTSIVLLLTGAVGLIARRRLRRNLNAPSAEA